MKIAVQHSTRYRYDLEVILEPHIFRLQPRMTTLQRLLAFDLQIVFLMAWSITPPVSRPVALAEVLAAMEQESP